jgi:quinol monooxygenase YgiN
MITLTVKITVPSERRKELLQSICLLAHSIRKEDGCISHRWYQDLEDRNEFLLVEEWNCEESLTKHLRSEGFGILSGALITLGNQETVRFAVTSDALDVM